MKQIIVIAILSLVIIGCDETENTSISVESLSPEEVNAEIESFREFIIPPKGTSKADVDAIFGVPKETKELKGKGSPAHYPMHSYQLLDPKPKQDFRAFLYVSYKDDKVTFIGINHMCVLKSRGYAPQGSPLQIKQQQEIDMENLHVLEDLIEIKEKYKSKLKNASWNK